MICFLVHLHCHVGVKNTSKLFEIHLHKQIYPPYSSTLSQGCSALHQTRLRFSFSKDSYHDADVMWVL